MSSNNRTQLFEKSTPNKSTKPSETQHTINLDNTQLLATQQTQLTEQDDRLDDILNGVTKLKLMSTDINQELLLHNNLISELDDTIDTTDTRIKRSTKGIVDISNRDAGGWCPFCSMVILLVMIVLLISTNWFCIIFNPKRC